MGRLPVRLSEIKGKKRMLVGTGAYLFSSIQSIPSIIRQEYSLRP